MRIIEVTTKRGDLLYGCVYGEQYKDTCLIITNGTGGNIFENKFLRVLGDECEKNGICYIYAHNSGAFHMINTHSVHNDKSGVTFELFDNSLEDLDAYIKWAKDNGYKKIILGGHSYGSNKVVYYLYKTKSKDITRYMLISPVDMEQLTDNERESVKHLLPKALEYKKTGRLDEIIPELYDGYCFYTARAFLNLIENKHLRNIPVYHDAKNFHQLESIKIDGLLVMGENDSFAKGDAANHLAVIKKHMTPDSRSCVIKGARHTFKGKEKEFNKIIIDYVKNWRLI